MTKNYIVLARKYRPKRLSDIIGQEDVCKILEGSFKMNRVAHAFIFSGTRGVGKTTLARIMAKMLNCRSEIVDDKPCGKCSNCISIDKESNIDVVEIDAASRTGVSDVREIIDNVNYKPTSALKKIYIIDEVHMLSKAAFNALLKTLEEPPEDVIFIFATTEIEKIPVTIVSRCQRFQLKRVDTIIISNHLQSIAKLEGFDLDDTSASLIAQNAEGSVRDALSLLDNVLARNEKIDISLIRKVLGLSDNTRLLELLDYLCKGDVENSLKIFDFLYKDGASLDLLAKSLMDLCYHLARIKVNVDEDYPFIDQEGLKFIKKISNENEMDFIVRFWELLQKYVNELSNVFDEKQCFEMIIMRLCYVALLPTPFEALKSFETKSESENSITTTSIPKSKEQTALKQSINENSSDNFYISQNENTARALKYNESNQSDEKLIKGKDDIERFLHLINLIEDESEILISHHLKNSFKLVRFLQPSSKSSAGALELEKINTDVDSKKILWEASKIIEKKTASRWIFSISNKKGLLTVAEYQENIEKEKIRKLKKDKLVKKILDIIPSSEVISIKKIAKND